MLGLKSEYIDKVLRRFNINDSNGYVFCLNGSAVSLKSSKQDAVADSTIEAEYIAASIPSIVDPIGLYYDNNGAIAQAKEPRSHQRSKHILRHYHLIREIIDRGDVKICKVPTLDNIADPLTKPLAQQMHDGHTRSMGIRVRDKGLNDGEKTCDDPGGLIKKTLQSLEKWKVNIMVRRWIPVFDESTGVPCPICRISPAGSRSVFPRQSGLKVVVSPSRVEIVLSPTSRRLLFSPQSALVVSSPAKSPSRPSSVEVIPGEGCPFPSSSAIPRQGGDWSGIKLLSRVPRAPQ
ncbi:hypothetical protein KIW84_055060 [Lathyrus oleraceus]|uniref:Uncharacterized protein n=1 Tax=Pisum sativum TaxID=3888 RepID=A0A9D5AJA5_PEA|nr:hypothetical protein KIW84_055060 [Pisum sativum]